LGNATNSPCDESLINYTNYQFNVAILQFGSDYLQGQQSRRL